MHCLSDNLHLLSDESKEDIRRDGAWVKGGLDSSSHTLYPEAHLPDSFSVHVLRKGPTREDDQRTCRELLSQRVGQPLDLKSLQLLLFDILSAPLTPLCNANG